MQSRVLVHKTSSSKAKLAPATCSLRRGIKLTLFSLLHTIAVSAGELQQANACAERALCSLCDFVRSLARCSFAASEKSKPNSSATTAPSSSQAVVAAAATAAFAALQRRPLWQSQSFSRSATALCLQKLCESPQFATPTYYYPQTSPTTTATNSQRQSSLVSCCRCFWRWFCRLRSLARSA